MKTIHLIVLSSAIFALTLACSDNKPDVTTPPPVVVIDSLKTPTDKISILTDSVNSTWNALIRLDSQKFADIKRLVEEISYCKKYDEKGVAKALKMNSTVASMQYTQANLSDSIITLYDTKTDDLIRFVRNLKGNTEEITQHPLADQLENEIMEADALLVNYRNKYDQAASEFNSFLDTNKEAIELKNLEKKRMFSVIL